MKAVILAGGRGTRLAPYTTVLPKPLMPIGDMPILEVVLRQLARAGFDDVTLAVGYLAELIMAYCGDGSRYGVRLTYSREPVPLGTAGPLTLAPGLDAEPFLVMNGDLLTTLDYAALWDFHRRHGRVATLTTYPRDIQINLGVIESDAADSVTNYIEKPVYHYEASTGIYVFEPAVLAHIPRGQRFDLPELVLRLLGRGLPVGRFRLEGYWLDIGRHDDYEVAMQEFAAHREQFLPPE